MPNAQLPGANLLAFALAAPTDLLNLATRQMTEAMGMMSMKAQQLGTELAAVPASLPLALPQGLPFPFPGMAGAGAGAPAPTPYTPPAAEVERARPGFII